MPDYSLPSTPSDLPDASNMRFGIVVTERNTNITDILLKKVVETFIKSGVSENSINIRHVPGNFDLVYGCARMAEHGYIDAIIALGCAIKGETPHFDNICSGTTAGMVRLNATGKVPIINGILTVNTQEQAEERAIRQNKGAEYAITAIKMVEFAHSFD